MHILNPIPYLLRFYRFFERNIYYIVPPAAVLVVVGLLLTLIFAAVNTLNETNKVILSIPVVLQAEMAKTRKVLREEADSSRQVVLGQHQMTREELDKHALTADAARHKAQATLDNLQKQAQEGPKQVQVQVETKRHRVLGIF